jgi:hypothetical protein
VSLAQDEHVLQALAPDRPDQNAPRTGSARGYVAP